MTYLQNIGSEMNKTTTENGAVTLRTSNSALVDFFALAGSTRENESLGLDLFKKAFSEDKEKAIKILFYLRDVRGGQGERKLFRNCLSYLAQNEKAVANKIAQYIPEYGRFDDLFVLEVETILPIISAQLSSDIKSDTPSLLAKWLPSENASSKQTKLLASGMRKALKMTPRQYRKTLSALRKKIWLVEQNLSNKEYNFDYSKVPSQASLKYKKAFNRNDEKKYTKYLESVTKGESKINTSTLYPYQVYDVASEVGSNELWNNLPDYTQGKNAIVVADVSGSMSGRPMSVSVSLALYFAERNRGQFKDHFITFSSEPTLQKIQGDTLQQKINSIERAEWAMSTDLFRVFKLLVDVATQNNTPVSEMPETIYIISDMEFNSACDTRTNFQAIQDLYAQTEYKVPNLVFWNVDARSKQVPVEKNQSGVTLVSGYSPTVFKMAVENLSPVDLMNKVALSERYANIKI
jgi:hypothetical protein